MEPFLEHHFVVASPQILICLIDFVMYVIIFATIIQGRKLIKGGNYLLLRGFYSGNYSREETIQGRKLVYEEIR